MLMPCMRLMASRLPSSLHRLRPTSSLLGIQSSLASSSSISSSGELSDMEYERLSIETLENLADLFDRLAETHNLSEAYDVQLAYGVLKVEFGATIGTYIINRQAPNKQLWLSSPTTGPKRYDYVIDREEWVYKHDSVALHTLLQEEISRIVQSNVIFPNR